LSMRMPRHMLKRPHCLVTPECQCDRFDLTVRFHPARLPDWVRRVDGETVRTFENAQPGPDLLSSSRSVETTCSVGTYSPQVSTKAAKVISS
jgi:hypothetical protein